MNRVGQHKHLGFTLTCNITWDSQGANVVKQANFKMSLLYGDKLLDKRNPDLLYKNNIRSIACLGFFHVFQSDAF